jgi:hypothetical protein
MKWLRWKWKCWRARHHAWLAYVRWYEKPCETTRFTWERAQARCEDMATNRP